MTSWADMDDDQLLVALGVAVGEVDDAVDERRKQAARAAFTWRTIDTELAELLHDSALDAGAPVRSAGDAARALSFARGELGLEVEIDRDVVHGQVQGGIPATVALQRPDGSEQGVETDRSGFFRVGDVAVGTLRFVVRHAGWTLTTPWVVL